VLFKAAAAERTHITQISQFAHIVCVRFRAARSSQMDSKRENYSGRATHTFAVSVADSKLAAHNHNSPRLPFLCPFSTICS
jgi:hypothetical protein